ncbi:MAG TPA: WhiB family transcriptional regulator [Mycobacterium sp.]|nr:WhiB family transcriptional regulator [Mycobacterium sp.]
MSTRACYEVTPSAVPCQMANADLWFSERRVDTEHARAICAGCPIRRQCLAAALKRNEPWGVWGGEIIHRGVIAAGKRARGRPPKNTLSSCAP